MNTFCHHPWVGLDVGTNGRIKPCCKFRYELEGWSVPYIQNGIKSYLNSEQLANLKQQFLDGKKPAGCVRCWKDEEANYPSKRQLDYQRWQSDLDLWDLNAQGFLFLTLPLGNFCNLKCRICGPESSTTWIKEHQELFGEKFKIQNWHKDSAIWKDIVDYSNNSLEIHIHGGEPFLYDSHEHLDLLDNLAASGASRNVRLHYNTNGTVFPDQKYWDIWQEFMWVDIQPSIDDMQHRFEYNRHPAKWNEAETNLLQYRDRVAAANNLQLSISTTVSAFTVFYLNEFFDYILSQGLPKPWLGRLQSPYYYKVGVFPTNVREHIQEKLAASKHEDIQKISSWLNEDDSQHWDTFLKYANMHDTYRKESFSAVFPELAKIISKKV